MMFNTPKPRPGKLSALIAAADRSGILGKSGRLAELGKRATDAERLHQAKAADHLSRGMTR
jgi:hypothetical protein